MQLGDWKELLAGFWYILNFVYMLTGMMRLASGSKFYNLDKVAVVIFFPVTLIGAIVVCIIGISYSIRNIFKIKGGWLNKEWK